MVYLIAIISSLTGFLFGFDEGIMSGAISAIQKDFNLTAKQVGFMMGLMPFGALASSCVVGRISDWFGRLRMLFLVPVLFTAAILILVLTSSYTLLCLSRILLGISIGMSVVISPLYIAETAPASIRGKLVVYFQLAITFGILCSYGVNLWHLAGVPWRWPFLTGLIPSTILFIGALFLPKSPRWLCAQGKYDEAKASLRKLYPPSHHKKAKVDEEFEAIQKTLKHKQNHKVWADLFSKFVRPCLYLGMLLFVFQQFSGINVVIYYAPVIFAKMQLGSTAATLLATFGIGLLNFLMTIVAMRWVERMGRRLLLIIGFSGTAATLLLIALMTYLDIREINWISATLLFLYIAAFAMSIGPIPWVMMPEIFPLKVRGQGASFSAASNWACNTIVVATFPIFLEYVGISLTFVFYGIACILGLLYSWFFVPETKHLSLEKIEKHVRSGKPLRMLGSTKDAT